MKTRTVLYLLAAIVLCGAAGSASAQEIDVGGGYGYASIQHEFDRKNYQGFWIDTSVYAWQHVGIVGEFDRLVWSQTYNAFANETHRKYGYLGGVRLTSARSRTASAFVDAVAGVVHNHTTLFVEVPTEISSSVFAIRFGGGTDVRVARSLSVRASGGVRIDGPQYSIAWSSPEWRLQAGAVYTFGR
jgi:hypothetical protein